MIAMLAAETDAWKERAERMFARLRGEARELAERQGVRIELASYAGFAGRRIIEYAAAKRCDRIIIGRSHRGVFWRALFSPTANHLVRHSPLPVTIVEREP